MTNSEEIFFLDENGNKKLVPELQDLGKELHLLTRETSNKAKAISEKYNIELDTVVQFNIKNPQNKKGD